ncbi:MAG TPA: hypothetical protein VGS97_25665 [Actinocrinis sp.]|uniref:hypothetical protein n=1 Tax=Actinocrinis sp. TaxID=1920516 RepID=UPI002DDCDD72|nr:hypothetical protein [Actinocrinis sp.]HEV2347505.1 hypothetical protein [Actinocrinis sp.]
MSGHTRKPAGSREAGAYDYVGRRRARADDYGSHGNGFDANGQRLNDTAHNGLTYSDLTNNDSTGFERSAAQRGASRPRTRGRRRTTADEPARPHLSGRIAKAGPLALALAVGGAVAAFAAPANAPAIPAAPQPTCTLQVPEQPLTAQGLATPFVLSGGGQACHESDSGTAAFVQGLVLDPATGHLSVYDPLVVDAGMQPAVAPTVPALPANAVVALWFGFNGNVLALTGGGVKAGSCVNGTDNSPFGQFSYCNAPAFFAAANTAIAKGEITVPPLGDAADGKACPTTRDFGIVDQDQSDNMTTTYLVLPDGRTAQNTRSAAGKLAGKTLAVMANGSDNLLLDHFVDPALDCTPFTAPDLANPGFQATGLGLNELQAAAHQAAPIALVPVDDPMVLDNGGAASDTKTDLYRAGVDQPPLSQASGSAAQYCANLRTIGVMRTRLDRSLTDTTSSPDPGAASNLFTFLAQRLQQSYVNLGCEQLLNVRNPVHLKTDANGVAVDATFDQVDVGPTPTPSASAHAGASTSASPSGSPSTSPVTPTAEPSRTPSHSPEPAKSSPAPTQSTGGSDDPNSRPGAAVSPSTNAAAPASSDTPNQPSQPTKPDQPPSSTPASTSAPAAGSVGSRTGSNGGPGTAAGKAAAGTQPVAAVTSTPISVAGFEHEHAGAARNPNSALSGPDPMADSGFDPMSPQVLWALGAALVVLFASLLYQRRPRQRGQGRRGSSS